MWTYEHSVTANAPAEAIFALYQDAPTWALWHPGLEAASIDGPFVSGTKGRFTPVGREPIEIVLVDVRSNESFSDESVVAGATILCEHLLNPLDNGLTRITHRLVISGPGSDELGPKIGPPIVAPFPEAMEALARLARELSGDRVG